MSNKSRLAVTKRNMSKTKGYRLHLLRYKKEELADMIIENQRIIGHYLSRSLTTLENHYEQLLIFMNLEEDDEHN